MTSKIVLLMLVLAVSCAPQPQVSPEPDTPVTSPPGDNIPTSKPSVNPLFPQPGDEDLTRGNVYLTEASLLIRERFPPQVSLSIRGDLPTPCNQLRVAISTPDAEKKIVVDVYSLLDPDQVCVQVLEPFEEAIDMGTFPTGHYSVWVNGNLAGEFDT